MFLRAKYFLPILLFASLSLQASYISVFELTPGQLRFSSKNVEEKVTQAIQKKEAFLNSQTGKYIGKYYGGKSLFPESEALPIVRSCFGFVLVDGHHHTLAALALGLPWVPVNEIADLKHLSEEEFWQIAEENGWVYLYDLEGKKNLPPKDFKDLQDDPNRYFAAITARKCPPDGDMEKSKGAEYPLWIKVGKDIPFIEFKISDVLLAHHFYYQYEMGDNPDPVIVEEARKILVNAQIPGLRVVPERKHWTEISSHE